MEQYDVYLGSLMFPVTPGRIEVRGRAGGSILALLSSGDGECGEVSLPSAPGLRSVEFEALLPAERYDFAHYSDGFRDAAYYTDMLLSWQRDARVLYFQCVRRDARAKILGMDCTVEGFDYCLDAKNGRDTLATVRLREYKPYALKVTGSQSAAPSRDTTPRPADTAPVKKTHTVVKGDSLWAIAKKYLGSGARYMEIYALNRGVIADPSLIYADQVIVLP